MLKIFLFAIITTLLQVQEVNSAKMLSCELAISPFKDLTCQSEKPYIISAAAVTYLVQRGQSTFQLKIKTLTEEEYAAYKDVNKEEVEHKARNPPKESKKVVLDEKQESKIQKEIVSREKDEKNRKIETDSDPMQSQQDSVSIEVDNQISQDRQEELKNIKKQSNQQSKEQLKQKIENEFSREEDVEEAEFVNNPYIILQIPKKRVVRLNEAKLLLFLNDKRYFQSLIDEHVFAGFQIMLLEHFKNGSLRDFLSKDSQLPESQRFFGTEISKMKFMEKLTEAVIDLHRTGFIHVNLSPDSVFLNDDMDPVIGNFEYVHEGDSLSQLDMSFFATQGEFAFTTSLESLNFQVIEEMQNSLSEGDSISRVKTKLVDSEPTPSANPTGSKGQTDSPKVQIRVKFTRSLEYLAPELIIPEPNHTFYFNQKMDTYSLGAIYYFMLYGRPPFEGQTRETLIHNLGNRFVTVFQGTSNNSVSILGNSLGLVPDVRTSTYFLGLLITRELSRNFEHKLLQDLKISTDFEYTNKYGRDFFDKYSEMIFVLIMAFLVIPLTVFLASYKFKSQNQENDLRENQRNNNAPINMNQAPSSNNSEN